MGLAVTHVDDIFHIGTDEFDREVMGKLKNAFDFGSEESEKFRYVGLNMHQKPDGVLIDQNHYVRNLELPDMNLVNDCNADIMPPVGQKEFRSAVGKLLAVGGQSRPDVCFDAKCLSTKFSKATKRDKSCFEENTEAPRNRHANVFS